MMLGAMKHIKIVNSVIEHSVRTKISNADENVKTATENVNTADNTPENVLYLSRISVSILSKVRSPTSGRGLYVSLESKPQPLESDTIDHWFWHSGFKGCTVRAR